MTVSAPPLEIAYSQADVRLGLFLTHRLSIDRDSSKERRQPDEEEEVRRNGYVFSALGGGESLGRRRRRRIARVFRCSNVDGARNGVNV